MRSFLAYVAEQYGRKKEDVATDALAYLLRRHPDARNAFQSLLAEKFGYVLPKGWCVRSRTKGPNGVPDLRISDENDVCCALIEMKFRARLTEHQPVGYFKELGAADGLVLFVAPADLLEKLWKDLERRCKGAGRAIQQLPNFKYSGQSARHRLSVVSWEQLIRHLETSLDKVRTRQSEALVFIDQLRRVCEVANKEQFDNLTPEQLHGVGASGVIRQLIWITRELIDKCTDENVALATDVFQEDVDISESSLVIGRSLKLDEIDIWIGLWPKAWEERGVSPLWIVFYLPEFGDHPVLEELQRECCDGGFVKEPFFAKTNADGSSRFLSSQTNHKTKLSMKRFGLCLT